MRIPDPPASAEPELIGPPPGNQPPTAIAREEARTLSGLFARRVARSPQAIAYTQYDPTKAKWNGYTWSRVRDQAARWQAAFDAQGLAPGDRVAILDHNGVDWVAFDQAALASGLVVVSLYPADSAENLAFILQDCGAKLLFVGERSAWRPLAACRSELVELSRIVCRNTIGSQVDFNVLALNDWLPAQTAPLDDRVADPDDLATLIYTSGTTGQPKGVMLSHANILSSAHGLLEFVPGYPDDVFISYLPLAHSFERTVGYYLPMIAGCRVAYARSVDDLLDDLQIIRPTIFLGVPRIYERICVGVRRKAEKTALGRRLLSWTLSLGRRRFEAAQGRALAPGPIANLAWRFLERLIARRVLARLGGRVRVAACGGAPLLSEVSNFLLALGVPLIEGYGLTEVAAPICGNRLEDNLPGTVGKPLAGVSIKLNASDELLIRGPSVMRGYWNQPAATRDAIELSGWFRTGDWARLREGRVILRGRLNDVLVMSTGAKAAPADIEMAIGLDPLFDQAMVIGNGMPHLSALLVLNEAAWREFAVRSDVDPDAAAGLDDAKVNNEILHRLARVLRAYPRHAQVRAVHLTLEPWTVANGLLTPTMKLRRDRIARKFADAIRETQQKASGIDFVDEGA